MGEITQAPQTLPEVSEASVLAREMADAYARLVGPRKEALRHSEPEKMAALEAPAAPGYEASIRRGPPEDVTWYDLQHLTEHDPEGAAQRWEEIKQAAREELQSGHRAARVLENYRSGPWHRAQFLAIREELTRAWQPQNGIERQLLDMMAQAQAAGFFWQEILATWTSLESWDVTEQGLRGRPRVQPRISGVAAVEQAGAMIDRFNKLILRTLRALQDLRRHAPAVVVQNAGQINVAGQQLNVVG